MEALKHIAKIREYCDYVEEHLLNVNKAWKIVEEKCKDLNIIYDDNLWFIIDGLILSHDISKMSQQEFIPYQEQFFPVGDPPASNREFLLAWDHHKKHNPHHWENWTTSQEKFPNEHACHCLCMVIDWMAMGMKFGDTAESYYKKNKDKINLPNWADKFVMDIFERLKKREILG